MNPPTSRVLADPELLELLAEDPELLAIADAVAATTPSLGPHASSRSADGRGIATLVPRRKRWLAFAAVLAAAVVAAPALAFPSVRGLVGLDTRVPLPPAHYVVAKARVESIFKPAPYALTMAKITFTVGEPGKPPGTGIRRGAYFLVFVFGNNKSDPSAYGTAKGSGGHYQITVHVPKGGIDRIRIGGFMNANPSPADGGKFWIPVKVETTGNF